MRRRLDVELVRRGILATRSQAVAAVEEGQVLVAGAIADKPARLVAPGEPIELRRRRRFVSRGGLKLEAALERFELDVTALRCLDAGASTGGFTDCLLQRGAAEVVAADVGRGQLHARLRSDPRVVALEGVNVRNLSLDDIGGPVDFVAADLSFISLRLVAPALAGVVRAGAAGVLLVKPQFEAGREQVGRGGVVRDPAVHREVLRRVAGEVDAAGLAPTAVAPSPVRGPAGNVEFLLAVGAAPGEGALSADAVEEAVDAAVEEGAEGAGTSRETPA